MSIDHLARPLTVRTPAPPPTPRPSRGDALPAQKLNLRFLLYLIAVAAAVSAVWCGVHWWQVRNNAAALLVQADAAGGRGDPIARPVSWVCTSASYRMTSRRGSAMAKRLTGWPARPGPRREQWPCSSRCSSRDPDRNEIRRRLAAPTWKRANSTTRFNISVQLARPFRTTPRSRK